MTSKTYKPLVALLLAATALSAAAAASTTNYYIVVPVLGKRAPATPAPAISVALAEATLPAGMVGALYPAVDLNHSLQVMGDSSYNAAQVAWTVPTGALPEGLHLDGGVISGTPTAQTARADFTVLATYKLKSGQQAYTIVVDGVTLQVTSISAGHAHTCAVTTAGGAKCWGNNGYGRLGDGTWVARSTPGAVVGLASGVASISAGTHYTCAITTAGAAYCWGYNSSGQLGDGTFAYKTTPVAVVGLGSGVASISLGSDHTCAVTTGGAAKCWGHNGIGNLGDGTTVNSATPVAVSGLASGVAKLEVGSSHTCVVTTAGAVQCWGANGAGTLGDGTTVSKSTPVAVSGLASGVSSLSVGNTHTCAVTAEGGVKCWGNNSEGQLGDGALGYKTTPAAVPGLASGMASVAAGNTHACAVTTAGAVKCWGVNSSGQLGDGTTVSKVTPVAVSGLASGVVSLTSGGNHTCARAASGALKCWGSNNDGQLGDGTTVGKLTPVAVLP